MPVSRRFFLGASTALIAGTAAAEHHALRSPDTPSAWKLPPKRPYQHTENQWIPLKDGTRLAARLWIPEGAQTMPVPVVWEYLPYRKRDMERQRDTGWAEIFAPYGFAFVRVDI